MMERRLWSNQRTAQKKRSSLPALAHHLFYVPGIMVLTTHNGRHFSCLLVYATCSKCKCMNGMKHLKVHVLWFLHFPFVHRIEIWKNTLCFPFWFSELIQYLENKALFCFFIFCFILKNEWMIHTQILENLLNMAKFFFCFFLHQMIFRFIKIVVYLKSVMK